MEIKNSFSSIQVTLTNIAQTTDKTDQVLYGLPGPYVLWRLVLIVGLHVEQDVCQQAVALTGLKVVP